MASRRLELHVSALNDAEYKLYTTSLADITLSEENARDDAYFGNLSVSVREARAWLRGRYSHLPAATLDSIMRLFSPNLAQSDVLSGGQFFAALRLVLHAESGKDVDRALAFVQAHPLPISSRNPFSAPPQHRFSSTTSNDGATLPPLPPRKPPPPPRHGSIPPPPPPKPATSALMKQSLIASKNGKTIKQAEEHLEKERVLRVLKSSERTRSLSPNKVTSSASSTSGSDQPPPLPKRNKKPPSPPMSTSSFQQVALAGTNPFKSGIYSQSPSTSPSRKSVDLPPPKHPESTSYRKPPPPIPSNLAANASTSGRKRIPLFRNSTESLTGDKKNFEATYGSTPQTASPYISSFASAPSDSTPAQSDSPTPSRIFRSKSLHHPSSPSLANRLAANEASELEGSPFSPLDGEFTFASRASPRKRPESVQVLGERDREWSSSQKSGLGHSPSTTDTNLSRHMSLSTPSPPTVAPRGTVHQRKVSSSAMTASDSSPLNLKSLAASLQPQISSMQQQLQPHLDKARFKAEAGLSKRGFVREHSGIMRRREEEEGLMRNGWEQSIEDSDEEGNLEEEDVDDELERRDRVPRSMSTGRMGMRSQNDKVGAGVGVEKDNLKWPVAEGEGWKPL